MYKSLNRIDLVSVDELPRLVQLYGFSAPIIFSRLETKMATLAVGDPFIRSILGGSSNDKLFLLFMKAFTTAVIQDGNFFTCLIRILKTCED